MDDKEKRARIYELMKRFIWVDEPIDVVTWTSDGSTTLLQDAAFIGSMEAVKLLVELNADVNSQGDRGYTPLHDAALTGNFEIYDYLVANGASEDIVNDLGNTLRQLRENFKG